MVNTVSRTLSERFRRYLAAGIGCTVALGGLVACGDDDSSTVDAGPGTDSGVSDSGGIDAGVDSGTDAGADAGLPLGTVAVDVCPQLAPGHQVVSVSADGSKVAYVRCVAGAATVLVNDLAAGATPVEIADASPETSVEFLLDDEHVLYGSAGSFSIRSVDASTAAVPLAAGNVDEYRSFLEKVSNTEFEPRVMVLETDAAIRRVSVRGSADGYVAATTLLEDADLAGGLELISASGRTLVAVVGQGVTEAYSKIRTNGAQGPIALPFGPADLAMAPVGLGDTHNFARAGDRFVRVELETGTVAELVAASTGFLEGDEHLIEREDSPGRKFAHFILDGNPSRRLRDATEALETLAEASATAQAMSPDTMRIVYLSDAELRSVPAGGGATPLVVVPDVGGVTRLVHVFAPDSSEIAVVTVGDGLTVAPLDAEGGSAPLASDGVLPASVGYRGDGQVLLWIHDGPLGRRLFSSTLGSSTANAVPGVEALVAAWWRIPDAAEVLYLRADGTLVRLMP